MPFIDKLRDTLNGSGTRSRSEQVEILWRAWAFAAVCGILACIGTLVVTIARLVELLT
ncbi:hypothetical protein [Collinsella aerofaciens]|uniref:hypothetical protein n=1 Tax=Collinsella aerofaciens TaxID=74426 RepID=UPI00232FA1DC|nr:hypothetical protein [Collinsella aerofaciens]MDB1909138.1 hypothetical protein [Collinsella aerofaciens]MDB1911023.1 hypothetical protein [Collinsella aerofaciens]MDB1912927.1 hypothetical protein [Collinsella aerofaciens]